MISTLLSTLLLLAADSHVTAASANDIDSFIKSSEACALWRDSIKDHSTPASAAVTGDTCNPLPRRLAELRAANAHDVAALQRLNTYDGKTGQSIAPLPKDVAAVIDRLQQCGFLGGEFGGDGSTEDRATTLKMDKLRCGDALTADLHNLRQRFRDDVRVSTRLAMYDNEGTPIALIPEDLSAFETQSGACAEQHGNSTVCTQLPAGLTKLLAKYHSQRTLYPEHCVWDEEHCYDSTTGLPVQINERWDASKMHVLKDPASGKPLISITPRKLGTGGG
ncbi:hypothetical protein [Dyella tabacisoli]|uniref:Uncharacterized protein n=1 Tax=Dyella tabacisoli TaxID=2282381 RepID=A0A369UV64_9GAMM|nr:hypothetical protein [Dyella tabacisoli]RDD83628.1 hypothetical protein DVJ77_03375 [Dyella tabacisoli]